MGDNDREMDGQEKDTERLHDHDQESLQIKEWQEKRRRKMSRFGQNIKKYRTRKKMTQTALAKKAGVDPCTISNIEAGIKWAGPDSMVKIAEAMGVSVAALWREV